MKAICTLLLLIPALSFGQVTINSGICSTPTPGGTIQWSCTFVADPIAPPPIEPPPPVDPPIVTGFTTLNCIGDSWTANDYYQSWCNVLAGDTGTPLDNRAVSGATTAQMDGQAQQEVSQGVDPTGLYTWWSFPNDLDGLTDMAQLPPIIQGIEDNATATFSRLQNAGVIDIVILTTPNFQRIPFTNQPGSEVVSNMINTAIRNAAASVGWASKVYDTDPFFLTVDISHDWLSDGRHFNQVTHNRLAAQIQTDIF